MSKSRNIANSLRPTKMKSGAYLEYMYKLLFITYNSNYNADHFSECVENHAFETYDKFIKVQRGELVFGAWRL